MAGDAYDSGPYVNPQTLLMTAIVWDGDWTVRSRVTERGWEAEMAIPLKTLRYPTGADRTWGFNVLRNIRHKNEQVYLSPIPRGSDIYRVSLAAKVNGLTLGVAAPSIAKWNRAYGVDANIQVGANQRLLSFIARTDSPDATRSDYAGRAFYNFTNNLWQVSGGYSQVGERFNPRSRSFLPRRGFRRPNSGHSSSRSRRTSRGIRCFAPHYSWNAFWGLDDKLQSSMMHVHPFEIQPAKGGRFGWFFDRTQDNPDSRPFTVYNRDGRRVTIPVGDYTWIQHAFEYQHNPSARVTGISAFGSVTTTTATSTRSS